MAAWKKREQRLRFGKLQISIDKNNYSNKKKNKNKNKTENKKWNHFLEHLHISLLSKESDYTMGSKSSHLKTLSNWKFIEAKNEEQV